MLFNIAIDKKEILLDLELTIYNHTNGNYKKWGLNPILPDLKNHKNYIDSANFFLLDSDWSKKTTAIIPEIKSWCNSKGKEYTLLLCKKLNIQPPKLINVFLIPFGPGGSYYPDGNAIRVRIRQHHNTKWWQHVIVHEITHLINFYINENSDHNQNEKNTNILMEDVLKELQMENSI